MGKIMEGRWDCDYCGTKGIRGSVYDCPGCGHPRDDDVEFYLPENEPEVTDKKLLEQANAGPDWYCKYCNSGNHANDDHCDQCGAVRSEHDDSPQEEKPAREIYQPRMEAERPRYPTVASRDHYAGRLANKRAKKPNSKKFLKIAGLSGVILIIAGLIFLYFKTSDTPLTLTQVSWERQIQIEKYKTVTEEDWKVPTGGRVISSRQKEHHKEKVQVGWDEGTRPERVKTGTETKKYNCRNVDKKNGFFEEVCDEKEVDVYETKDIPYKDPVYEDKPVYKTWYTYEIERWVPERTVQRSGSNQDPQWPDTKLFDKERAGRRSQTYTAFFKANDGKEYKLEMDLSRWQKLAKDRLYIGKINAFGVLRDIEENLEQ